MDAPTLSLQTNKNQQEMPTDTGNDKDEIVYYDEKANRLVIKEVGNFLIKTLATRKIDWFQKEKTTNG